MTIIQNIKRPSENISDGLSVSLAGLTAGSKSSVADCPAYLAARAHRDEFAVAV